MFHSVFAMPGRAVILSSYAGFLVVLVVATIFVTATKHRPNRSERNRRAALGITAIRCGPLIGASLACLMNTLGEVHPADVTYTFVMFTIIGSIAGFCAGIFFAITALFCGRNVASKAVPAKAAEFSDDL